MLRFLVTWRNRVTRKTLPVGGLAFQAPDYTFTYMAAAFGGATGFDGFLGFPSRERIYKSRALFPFFAQRVMDRRRPDYPAYLDALALTPEASDLDVLGRSQGQRKGDTAQVLPEPGISETGELLHRFLLSGVRHAPGDAEARALELRPGELLHLVPDSNNTVNSAALLASDSSGQPIGWIPDPLLGTTSAAGSTAKLTVIRVNDLDWPSHLRLVVQLEGTVPKGFDAFGLQTLFSEPTLLGPR